VVSNVVNRSGELGASWNVEWVHVRKFWGMTWIETGGRLQLVRGYADDVLICWGLPNRTRVQNLSKLGHGLGLVNEIH
jgi:hypothetical protein